MSTHHEANDRAMRRCEEAYLREPAWRSGDDDACERCADGMWNGGPLCRACEVALDGLTGTDEVSVDGREGE